MSPEPQAPLLRVDGLTSRFRVRRGLFGSQSLTVHASENVSFSVGAGEIVGLIGESGSGKSTVGRAIVRLEKAASGSVFFDGENALAFSGRPLKRYRRKVQVILQDPAASLDPMMRVRDLVAEPLRVHRIGDRHDRNDRVVRLLEQVGLGSDALRRFPHEFSGGQRQRIGMARALAVGPQLIVADEPVSALDVSVQAQVINLLQELRQALGLALLFISHDLPTVEFLCDRVVVMYLGRVMEIAPAEDFQTAPLHPYSRMLVDDAPKFGRGLRRSAPDTGRDTGGETDMGASASPLPPVGCVFRTRCPHAIPDCGRATPALEPVTPDRSVACIRRELFS
jgi:oligopeptide/dipeptide ABC transporter ATP-binding protein